MHITQGQFHVAHEPSQGNAELNGWSGWVLYGQFDEKWKGAGKRD